MKTKNKILPEQEEEKTFQYRTYGKGELALLYLPNILQQSAVDRFNEWIEASLGGNGLGCGCDGNIGRNRLL